MKINRREVNVEVKTSYGHEKMLPMTNREQEPESPVLSWSNSLAQKPQNTATPSVRHLTRKTPHSQLDHHYAALKHTKTSTPPPSKKNKKKRL